MGEDEEGRDDEGAHNVNVRERIEGEAAGETRGRVAERVGGVAVRYLVRDDGEDKDDEEKDGFHVLLVETLNATMRPSTTASLRSAGYGAGLLRQGIYLINYGKEM